MIFPVLLPPAPRPPATRAFAGYVELEQAKDWLVDQMLSHANWDARFSVAGYWMGRTIGQFMDRGEPNAGPKIATTMLTAALEESGDASINHPAHALLCSMSSHKSWRAAGEEWMKANPEAFQAWFERTPSAELLVEDLSAFINGGDHG